METEKEKQLDLYLPGHFHRSYESHCHHKGAADSEACLCVCPGPKGTRCLLEPRIPNNGLVVKSSHKSTQESSEHRLYHLPYLHDSKPTVCLGRCDDGRGARVPSAGFGNVPMGTAFRSPSPRQKHLQGWMMSWVPLPKVSRLEPPVFTL